MSSNKKFGTYLVEFTDGEKMVFGNNYKAWWQHATEFIYRNYGNKEKGWRYQDVANVVKDVLFSNQQFYDDGGLKWCSLNAYQEVVDEVCEQDGIVPILVDDMTFTSSPTDKATLTKKLKEY